MLIHVKNPRPDAVRLGGKIIDSNKSTILGEFTSDKISYIRTLRANGLEVHLVDSMPTFEVENITEDTNKEAILENLNPADVNISDEATDADHNDKTINATAKPARTRVKNSGSVKRKK